MDISDEETGFNRSSCIRTYSKKIPETNNNDESIQLFDKIFGSKTNYDLTNNKINNEKDQENQENQNINYFNYNKFSPEKNKLKKKYEKKNSRKRTYTDLKSDLFASFQKTGIDETLKKFKEIPLNIIYENSKGDFVKHENTYYDCDKNEYFKEVFVKEVPSKRRKTVFHDFNKRNLIEKNENNTPKNKKIRGKLGLKNCNSILKKNENRFSLNLSEIENNCSFFEKNSFLNSTVLLSRSLRKINFNNNFSIKSIESENDLNCTQDKCLSNFCDSFSQNHILHKLQEFNNLDFQQKILKISQPNYITTFSRVLSKDIIKNCKKIGEGSYGEVFISNDGEKDIILKIIKLPEENLQKACSSFLPEILIGFCLSELYTSKRYYCTNFINFKKCSYLRGKYPKKLIEEWNKYSKTKGSENENPDHFKSNSQYFILSLENGGVNLENYQLNNAKQAISIFKQCLIALSVAEKVFKFEHRDLHLGNILVSHTDEKELNYIIDYKNYTVATDNLKISIIDYTLSRLSRNNIIIYDDLSKYNELFEGEGDYQYEIYRKMKDLNQNDWRSFNPKTNLMWLHYLLVKLLENTKDSTFNLDKKSVNCLQKYEKNILKYKCAFDAIKIINT